MVQKSNNEKKNPTVNHARRILHGHGIVAADELDAKKGEVAPRRKDERVSQY